MIVGVFGVGAIGGSIALRAKRNGDYVLGFDPDPDALALAQEIGAVDEAASCDALAQRAQALVIAAHLGPTLREIERLKSGDGASPDLIMDVSSVKLPVVRAAKGLKNFVATHPMAGTQRSGAGAARADLFDGRPWAYVATSDVDLDARACSFITSLGGEPIAMSAEEHDRIVAITSHVPQVVAYCYERLLQGSEGAERLCGPVARELLRISTMSRSMWSDIFTANAVNIERELRRLIAEMEAEAGDL
jgi:prephenate dehydrogenase